MASVTEYYQIIRKIQAAFASLFKNITFVRYNSNGTELEHVLVPVIYGPKEKYIQRLEGDPDLNKKIQITLPRISYEMIDFGYDASRKLNTNIKNFAINPSSSSSVYSQYNPVPYDFFFNVYIETRNVEDSNQILELILPYFTPDYTIKVNLIPEMGMVKSLPVLLNKAVPEIDYEGDNTSKVRTVIWTLNFTVKGFIFGAINKDTKIINTVINNILLGDKNGTCECDVSSNLKRIYKLRDGGYGKFKYGETVYQGLNLNNANATGVVKYFNPNSVNNVIELENILGTFLIGHPIQGVETSSKYIIEAIYPSNTLIATIVTVPIAPNSQPVLQLFDFNGNSNISLSAKWTTYPYANANSFYFVYSTIKEYPNLH